MFMCVDWLSWPVHSGGRHLVYALAYHWQHIFPCLCIQTHISFYFVFAPPLMLCPYCYFNMVIIFTVSVHFFLVFFLIYFAILSDYRTISFMLSFASRCLNSVNRVDVDCKAIPVFRSFVRALTDLLAVSRLMRWDERSCDVNSFATCLVASKAAQTHLLPAHNKYFRFTVALCILFEHIFYFFISEWCKCVCKHARPRASFSLFASNYKSHATTQKSWVERATQWKLRITANIRY